MTIRRYEHQSLGPGSGMDEDADGEYVRFEDVVKMLERHRDEQEVLEMADAEVALDEVLGEMRAGRDAAGR